MDSASDRAVLEEKDDAFFVDVGKTKDHSFVVINVHSKTTSEVYLLPGSMSPRAGRGSAAGVEGKAATVVGDAAHEHECADPTLLRRRRQGVEYYVDHSGDAFYIVTNSPPSKNGTGVGDRHGRSETPRSSSVDGGEYRLVRVPLQQQPGPGGRRGDASSSLEGVADVPWEAVPCGRHPGTVQEMDLFRDHCVLYETCPVSGCPRLRVVPLAPPPPAAAGGDGIPSSPFVVSPPNAGGHCGGSASDSVGDSVGDNSVSDSASDSVRDSASDSDSLGASGPAEQGAPAATSAAGGATASSAACTLRPGVNSWFEARTARFSLSSPLAPEDVYDVCLESGRVELLRRTEVPGSPRFDGRDYR